MFNITVTEFYTADVKNDALYILLYILFKNLKKQKILQYTKCTLKGESNKS